MNLVCGLTIIRHRTYFKHYFTGKRYLSTSKLFLPNLHASYTLHVSSIIFNPPNCPTTIAKLLFAPNTLLSSVYCSSDFSWQLVFVLDLLFCFDSCTFDISNAMLTLVAYVRGRSMATLLIFRLSCCLKCGLKR